MKAKTQSRAGANRGRSARMGARSRSGRAAAAQPRSQRQRVRARSTSAATSARANTRSPGSRRRSGGAKANRTRDHEEIRRWVESRGGTPALVKRTQKGQGDHSGVLRIDFPGYSGEGSLQAVSWDEWFDIFDDRNLEFLYQEKAANGKPSRFNKLVCPE